MNNSDMPAMPSGISQDFNNIGQEPMNLGLTKREYIAAVAMQGILAAWGQHDVTDAGEIASDAVLHADALLAELERTGGKS